MSFELRQTLRLKTHHSRFRTQGLRRSVVARISRAQPGRSPISVNLTKVVSFAFAGSFSQRLRNIFPVAQYVRQSRRWQNGCAEFTKHEFGFSPSTAPVFPIRSPRGK